MFDCFPFGPPIPLTLLRPVVTVLIGVARPQLTDVGLERLLEGLADTVTQLDKTVGTVADLLQQVDLVEGLAIL